jgi:hypothetical protein
LVGAAAKNHARQISNQRSQESLALAQAKFDALPVGFDIFRFFACHTVKLSSFKQSSASE